MTQNRVCISTVFNLFQINFFSTSPPNPTSNPTWTTPTSLKAAELQSLEEQETRALQEQARIQQEQARIQQRLANIRRKKAGKEKEVSRLDAGLESIQKEMAAMSSQLQAQRQLLCRMTAKLQASTTPAAAAAPAPPAPQAPQAPPAPPAEEAVDECPVCFDAARDAAFIPCGHRVCRACSRQLTSCPVCRGRVERVLSLF